MEDSDDWLVNNKTWKKWTRIGNGEPLSYSGINFHKPIDKEQLVKEFKRRKKRQNMVRVAAFLQWSILTKMTM
jgi:hypothetical protein